MLDAISTEIPERRADLRDQLRRASASIVLNLAEVGVSCGPRFLVAVLRNDPEGAGEFSPGDKARFYRMARRSASECAAILDLLERTTPLAKMVERARPGIQEVGAMLTALVKGLEKRPR
jgi:hypothetical protein